ncbi:MAG: hypothetical protein CMJ46_12480 [Planctomyces sp.]|nr:hypothetical protein [Planctomyces sp.]
MPAEETIYLIPGFMSPAWMLYPLERALRKPGRTIVRWDYPQVLTDPYRTVDALCEEMVRSAAPSVSIVGHSFGDWIARMAINQSQLPTIRKLISICPVVAPVPFASVFSPVLGKLIPELVIMNDRELSSSPLSSTTQARRSIIWAKVELIVARPEGLAVDHEIWGAHISCVFQPNLWRIVEQELSTSGDS